MHRSEQGDYVVELRYREGVTDQAPCRGPAAIDEERLAAAADLRMYGEELFRQLFPDGTPVRAYLDRARDAQKPLRVRLFIGPTAPRLHALRWELLRHPDDDSPFAEGEKIFFSRYLSSHDWRPVQLRPRDSLRALVVVANPSDLSGQGMAPVRVEEEVHRARVALRPHIRVDV